MKKYVVWRRNDGLVAATVGHLPHDYNGADGSKTTFEKISEHAEWEDAYDAIAKARRCLPLEESCPTKLDTNL
jgi:hypothetical protein